MSRAIVMSAIRRALRRTSAKEPAPTEIPGRPQGLDSTVERTHAFRTRLESVNGEVHLVRDKDAARDLLMELVERRGWKDIAVSGAPLVTHATSNLKADLFEGSQDRDRLAHCDLGITAVQHAIAETGTLVLFSHAESHRLTSLLPPVHIALVEQSQIVAGLGDALALAHGADGGEPPPLVTFITGPSRTGDIELTMVTGVHGPRELIVILIAPDSF